MCSIGVSTGDQRYNGYSIDSQLRMIKEYCEKNNYSIVDVYNGAGHSSKDLMHPKMQRLLTDIKSKKIDKLIAIKDGDYYLTNLTLKVDEKVQINKYGMLRLRYLKENNKKLYTTFLMIDEFTNHLISFSNECENRLQILMKSYKKSDKLLFEKTKNDNPLEWTKLMNNYKNCVEEGFLKELIYTKNV